jgi:glycosyltransferase involved in cell wall biosynthesis
VHLMAVYSFPTIPTLLACNALRRPVVWSPRGMLQRWEASSNTALKNAWDQVCRVVSPRGMTLHFTSQEEADESIRRFRGFPWAVIPNGVELPERVEHVDDPSTLRVVYLGRLHPIKGLENLIEGFARYLTRATGAATLTLAGGADAAYVASLRAKIQALGIEGSVTMPGAVDGDAKRALFARADVVMQPSFRESFGIVIAESLAHEVPVIAGRGTPWPRLEDEGAGLWVPNDPASLAAAIERIAAMPRREMGRRGRAWVEREYSWDLVAERTIDLYRRVAGVGGSA